MKKGVLLVFCLSFVVVFSLFASAVCSSDSQTIFTLYSETNSHIGLYNNANYPITACYDSIFGSTGSGDRTCKADGSNVIFYKYSEDNSHVSTTKTDYYSIPVCYGDLSCHSATSCDSGEVILASLYSSTNSHISLGNDGNYPIKICCSGERYIDLDKITSLNWTDSISGEEISSSILNGTNVNISIFGQFLTGGIFDYEIYLDNPVSLGNLLGTDTLVASGSHIITSDEVISGVSSATSWFATWDSSSSRESSYYFKIKDDSSSKNSVNLLVLKENGESITKTMITSPVDRQVYLTNQNIPLSWKISEEHYPIKQIKYIAKGGIINGSGDEITLVGSQNYLLNAKLNVSYSTSGQKEIILYTTDGLDNVWESRATILVPANGINIFAYIKSPVHLSSIYSFKVQFNGLSSYIINKTNSGISCVAGDCPSSTSGDSPISISSPTSDNKLFKNSKIFFNWSWLGSADTISGAGSNNNISVFEKYQSAGLDKEVTLKLNYLDASSLITNSYDVVYSGLFCLNGDWMKGSSIYSLSYEGVENSCMDSSGNSCCPDGQVCNSTYVCESSTKSLCSEYNLSKGDCEDNSTFYVANKTVYNLLGVSCGESVYINGSQINSIEDCECVWDEDSSTCGVSYSSEFLNYGTKTTSSFTTGICVLTNKDPIDSCDETGYLTYSWVANWYWNESNPTHIDPSNQASKCVNGSNSISCAAQLQLPFFGIFGVIICLLVIGLIYSFKRK